MPILVQAGDFLRGIHDFSAAGALGVHCRGSRGRRRRLLWRRRLGAPRSRCDIPRRAPHRLGAGGRAAGEPTERAAGARVGARRGWRPGPAALSGSPARLRLGLGAARSASLALQVAVTHTDTRARPSRSLTPRLAAAQAKPTGAPRPSGGERARRAPGEGGRGSGEGQGPRELQNRGDSASLGGRRRRRRRR